MASILSAENCAMTTTLAISAVLVGALLGLRFQVLVLVPAIAIVALLAHRIGLAHHSSVEFTLFAVASAIAALQLGYLGGAFLQSILRDTDSRQNP